MRGFILVCCLAIFATGCTSTSSVNMSRQAGPPTVAVMPLTGDFGEQASDMIAQELAVNGIGSIERSRIEQLISEAQRSQSDLFDESSFADIGHLLGVRWVFVGTSSAINGPLYSFPHVNMTLRLVDTETGTVLWMGRYGNSMWTSAISTQGDLQRGSRHIVREFVSSYDIAELSGSQSR